MHKTQVEGMDNMPFALNIRQKGFIGRRLLPHIISAVEWALALQELNRRYAEFQKIRDERPFADQALEFLNINYKVADTEVSLIPAKGPVIIIANHPFGGLEGLILASILRSVRTDIKFMANYLLTRIPDFRDMIISVDPFKGRDSVKRNIRPLKEAIQWVRDGGTLVIFPAGEVSHININRRDITDPQWSGTIARLIRKTSATVVPVYFSGFNSAVFQAAGLIHSFLRTALLPRELLNKTNHTIQVRVGNPIPFKRLDAFHIDQDMVDYLRIRTYVLKGRNSRKTSIRRIPLFGKGIFEQIVPPRNTRLLAEEVGRLSSLAESGEYAVCVFKGMQFPNLLHEIGRLREITFRMSGEGTGKAIDLDHFDPHYLHLFVWNKERQEVVGAYRIGMTDEIMERYGMNGLYTSTLFKYSRSLLNQIGPALELGRSFIRPEYQKNYTPLLLLWKGIGRIVVENPRYKTLLGPVSINDEYDMLSKQLLTAFLKMNNYIPELARFVKPRRPFMPRATRGIDVQTTCRVVRNIEDVSSLIEEIESDHKGIPILLKQYLKLGGRLIGFNIDPQFSNVLDGLILVDLTKTEQRILERYMTKQGAEAFLAFHKQFADGKSLSRQPVLII
jgi:putative hemolysin